MSTKLPHGNYTLFKRSLAQHPGHIPAAVFTLASGAACYDRGGLWGAAVGAFGMGALLWTVILLTAWETRRLHE